MTATQPTYNGIPFGQSGLKNTIPTTTATFGAASFTNGFPNETMLDPTSGGIAPDGKDVNGILNQLSQHQVWLNAGGQYKFNAALATVVGGYALGAVVQSDDNTKSYVNTLAGNTSNPNVGGANWSPWVNPYFTQAGAGAVTTTIQNKARQIVSVFDFGAVGDGVADDILAFDDALAELVTRGGGECEVPTPTVKYSISRAIKLPTNCRLVGIGRQPIIHNTSTPTGAFEHDAVVVNKNFYSGTRDYNLGVINLTLRNRYQDYLSPVGASPNVGACYGVFFSGVTGFTIRDNHILDCIAEGIYLGGSVAARDLCSNFVVEGNTTENTFASGIAVTHGTRGRITGNLILNANVFGIDVEPNTGCVGSHLTIANNVIDGVQATYYKNTTSYGKSNALGISVNAGSSANQAYDITITGNTVRDVQRWTTAAIVDFGSICTIGALNIAISGNTIDASQSGGIVVRGGGYGVSVTGNSVKNIDFYGVLVSAVTSCSVVGNNISTTGTHSILVWASASKFTVTGNIVKDATGVGILMQACTVGSVSGNTVYDSRVGGARLCTYGIQVGSGCADITITGNAISNTTSDPTRDVDGATNVLTADNIEDGFWRTRATNYHLFSDGNIYKVGFIKQTPMTAASAATVSTYVNSTTGILNFKDAAGVSKPLYGVSGIASYDPPSIAAGGTASTTVTVTGAIVTDTVVASFTLPLGGLLMFAEVTAANTATVRLFNPTGSAIDIASGSLTVRVV